MASPEPIPENITQELYKRNAELALMNKTLSLLRKLYEISILTLEPEPLAERIAETIRTDLDFDLVGIFQYDGAEDGLTPLHLAKSPRLRDALNAADRTLDSAKIPHASRSPALGTIFAGSAMGYTENIAEIWSGFPAGTLAKVKEEAHVRTMLFSPLAIEGRTILGVLLIGLNREYQNLGEFEQESIRNFVNVIAIALEKALLYQELQISNRKLQESNERLEEFDRLKSEFVSMAGHQLRAPMTVIKGYLSLVMEGTIKPATPEEKNALEKAMFSTNQLIKLVSSLLDLSRMESGKIKYEFARGDFTNMVHEVIDKFREHAEKKKITIRFQDGEESPLIFPYDADKMREAVVNLIDNAIKYSPEKGEVRVREEVVRAGAEARVRLAVTDAGIGIKPEDMSMLFGKFSRTEEAKERDPNGMGIGLYFLKRVVEDHGGIVGAESPGVGKGSTFWIELPMGNSIQNGAGGRGM